MMLNKKAQGLSMTTIVVAALALLVLVVLTLIFTGRMGPFSIGVEKSNDCETFCKSLGRSGGEIKSDTTTCSDDDLKSIGNKECCCDSK